MDRIPEIEPFEETTIDPPVRGFLHRPVTPSGDGLILTHGAGGNAQAPLLRALADRFADSGFHVLRCHLPYRQERSYGPPRPADAERDRAGLENALHALKKPAPGRTFLGGHSYGGRQASMLVSEKPGLVAGLLLLSYPLHPPRDRAKLRVQHFPRLHTPALFVHGTRDPFGSIPEIEDALKLIAARTRVEPVEGAGHDLGFKGKGAKEELPQRILQIFQNFFA